MNNSKIVIRPVMGSEVNILNAETEAVKLNKTGVFVCDEGEVTLTIDDVEFRMSRHSMIVYFSYSRLRILSHSDDLKGILIGADLEMLQPLLYQITNFNAIFVIKKQPLQFLEERQYHFLQKYVELYVEATRKAELEKSAEAKSNRPLSAMAEKQIQLLTNCIILEVIECYTHLDIDTSHNSHYDEVLQNFVTTLYRKYRTEHEVAYYATQQCLSSRYFSAIIKEKSGKTPSLWIATALLVDAKRLLSTTNLSVKEVSDTLNFPNQSYFGKWFKHQTGVSPLDFRNGKDINSKADKDFSDVIARGLIYTDDKSPSL